MELNERQRQAVIYDKGPMLIVAGAGTGKTTVITEKIKYLMEKKGLSADQVLALTFTDKAAQEMVERLDVVMPLGYNEPWVSTFHKFCDRVLREEGLEIGLDPGYSILNQAEQWLLLKRNLFEFDLSYYRPLGNPNKFIAALLKVFSRAYDEDLSAKELSAFVNSKLQITNSKRGQAEAGEEAEKLLEVVRAMEKYEELKIKESALDFGDLMAWTLKLFRERKSVLSKYKKQFKQVLVDEFQDTNYAQYQLVKLLCPPNEQPKLTVVGDDSQSIYRFRGAAISNIMNFMEDYKKAERVVLTDNYRSYQPILDGAYRVIQHNDPETLEARLGISKDLKAVRKGGVKNKPLVVECSTGDEEVEMVIKKILELLAKEKYSYRDFAIVARANSQLEPYVAMLKQTSLPFRRISSRGLFDQEEVRVLMNFLEVVANPRDSVNLFLYLHFEGFGIEPAVVLEAMNRAKKRSVPLWEVVSGEEEFEKAVRMVKRAVEKGGKERPTKVLFEFVNESGYLARFIVGEEMTKVLAVRNLNLFFRYLTQLERNNPGVTVVELMQMLTDLMEAGENPSQAEVEDIDAITVSTVHAVKGLEFGVVFMVSLVAGRFPAYGRREPIELPDGVLKEQLPKEDKTAEERRLCYVGMTRAKERLYLSWAGDYGGVRKWKASGFLDEVGGRKTKYETDAQLSLLNAVQNKAPAVLLSGGGFEMKFTSYSQMDTFKACPLKFKYRYVLQVPAEPHHALSFGRSVHETLNVFHRYEMADTAVTKKKLLELFEQHFVDEGYESEEHKMERLAAGKKALTTYFQHYKELFGKPWRLEEGFRLNVAGVPLVGKIDRIDKNGDSYEIVDYKTGSAKDQRTVDRDEQLSIYALAARDVLGIEVAKLSLYFVEANEKVETKRSKKDLDKKKEDLAEKIEEIKKSKFEAKPGSPYPCGFCEYRKICPMAAK